MLKGKGKNTFAVGSSIFVYQGKQIISREVITSRGFESSIDYKVVVGLGKSKADSLKIVWPDLNETKIINPSVNTILTINQDDSKKPAPPIANGKNLKPFLTQLPQVFDKHIEDDYIDFYYERGIPMMMSKEGPKAATGDVNGDGLTDVYIDGTVGHPGQLYLQNTDGEFIKKEEADFKRFSGFEDVSAVFFDADGDHDLDLVVGSGGNNHPAGSLEFQNRLYRNDGNGNFTLDAKAIPLSGYQNLQG